MQTRLGPRINVTLKIVTKIDESLKQHVHLTKGNRFDVSSYDISAIGIGIYVKYFLPKGLILDLEMDGAPFGLEEKMKIKGEVRHCEYVTVRKYHCGIKFLNLPKNYKKVIDHFVSTHTRRKNPRIKLSD